MSHRQRRRKVEAVMPRQTDTERRLDALEQRLDRIDQTGTRGTEAVRVQLSNQATDLVALSGRLDKIDEKLDSAARIRFNQYIGLALALLPIYVLLFLTLFHVKPA